MNEPWSGLEGFMFAVNSIENGGNKGIMLEFRQDLAVKLEWRSKLIKDLQSFLASEALLKHLSL